MELQCTGGRGGNYKENISSKEANAKTLIFPRAKIQS
jgi:hypothetical protein